MGRFAGDPAIVGREIRLNGVPFTIVGVLPAGFTGLSGRSSFWVTRSISTRITYAEYLTTNQNFIGAVGRLRPGASPEQAEAEMRAIGRRIEQEHNQSQAGTTIRLVPLQEQIVGAVRPVLLVLLGAVGFVLLIACANVANLLLVRSAARERELAVRAAMGGSRRRLLAHLLVEGLLLSVMGALAGLALAGLAMPALLALRPADLPRMEGVGIDGTVLAFTAAFRADSRVDLTIDHRGVDRVEQGRIRPVELDERPRERLLQRVVRARLVQPRPRRDDAAGPDRDELAQLVRGQRVVLDRRHQHAAVARADAFETLLA